MQLPDPEVLLKNWTMLNHIITSIDDEDYCALLLELEKNGKRRSDIAFRIHSRFNKLRATRERLDLVKTCNVRSAKSKIKSFPGLKHALPIEEAQTNHR